MSVATPKQYLTLSLSRQNVKGTNDRPQPFARQSIGDRIGMAVILAALVLAVFGFRGTSYADH